MTCNIQPQGNAHPKLPQNLWWGAAPPSIWGPMGQFSFLATFKSYWLPTDIHMYTSIFIKKNNCDDDDDDDDDDDGDHDGDDHDDNPDDGDDIGIDRIW